MTGKITFSVFVHLKSGRHKSLSKIRVERTNITYPSVVEQNNLCRAPVVVGVDIGGTKVAAGLVNAEGKILARNRTPMITAGAAANGLAAVATSIRGLFHDASSQNQIAAVGICAPGPLNPTTGVILNPPNLAIWHNYPLAEEMRRVYNVPVRIDNDANAAALAEAKWGAGRGYRNFFYATVGTGIGTGMVLDGRIFHGKTGAAAEGGHLGIDRNGPVCNCGKRGCIETLAAGPAIARRARQKLVENPSSVLWEIASGDIQTVSSEMVGRALALNDPVAKEVMRETLDMLAYWLGSIIDLLEPDAIAIGGGVSSLLAPFLDEIREHWRGACINPHAMDIPLVLAHYGEDAGIAGAAALCE
ncbi:MAG: ROK family protein [Acidobacteriia bacterium]|nr:ROK family protein [Terriglobia bacterium]